MREVCGAVSGMLLVVGLETGAVDGRDTKGKLHNYEVVQQLAGEYRKKNGSIICRELLGLEKKEFNDPVPEARTKEYYKKRPCVNLVEDAVEIVEEYLLKEKLLNMEPPKLAIRKVEQEKELQEVADLATEIWHEFFPCILTDEQIDYMVEKFQSEDAMQDQITNQGYSYYQVRLGNCLIGYTGVKKEEKRLFLSKIYLKREYRGKGYASKVFRFLEDLGRNKGCNTMYLTVNRYNENSIAVYKKRGMKVVKEQVTDIGNGFVMDDFVMEKGL